MSGSVSLAAGAARADITPDPAMLNWIGYQPYDGVLDPIHARALVLGDGRQTVAILCWDLIDCREEAVAAVRRAIRAATGIPETHVLVNASHSHSAPRSYVPRPAPEESPARHAPLLDDPVYQEWSVRLPEACAGVVRQAQVAMHPATLAIGRANASEWLFNRRPRLPDGTVVSMMVPEDPYTLPDGMRFGPMDPTLTVLSFRGPGGRTLATLFHVPCHGVSIYPVHKGISADWPGPAAQKLAEKLGGEALFLQGCTGDIVPARRGIGEREQQAAFMAERAAAAVARSCPLPSEPLEVRSARIGAPLTEAAQKQHGRATKEIEVQVIACGPLAVVALPGEALIEVAMAIQARSPYPHTLVAGYSNGYGLGYVGLPGERARGGYEAGAGFGADECGQLLVETAVRLLRGR